MIEEREDEDQEEGEDLVSEKNLLRKTCKSNEQSN